MASPTTRHLTILLTDIKGFTDKTSHKTRADIQTMLDEHRAVVLPLLEGGGGTLIKTIGDAFLMTFESPTNAVLAGVAVQEALAKLNEGRVADDRLDIRIAINAGEVNLVEGDVFGEPVNITARIEGIAEAGQVYFTEAVYLAMNKAEVPSSEVGLVQLKGIPEKIRVYKVRREDPVGAESAAPSRPRLFGLLPPKTASAAPAFAPGTKAMPASYSGPLPSSARRAVALAVDAALCSMIVGAVFSGGSSHRHARKKKTEAIPALTMDVQGIRGAAGGAKITFDKSGLSVVPDKSKPAPAADEGDADSDGDFIDVFFRRIENGDWTFAAAWAIYNLFMLKWLAGATPGKRLMKLRVVSEDGAPLDKRQRLARSAISTVSGSVFFLGYLWALWEPRRRTWHDLMAGTRVVPAE